MTVSAPLLARDGSRPPVLCAACDAAGWSVLTAAVRLLAWLCRDWGPAGPELARVAEPTGGRPTASASGGRAGGRLPGASARWWFPSACAALAERNRRRAAISVRCCCHSRPGTGRAPRPGRLAAGLVEVSGPVCLVGGRGRAVGSGAVSGPMAGRRRVHAPLRWWRPSGAWRRRGGPRMWRPSWV